jgi:ATP/maltotriose-dependent transcriptional regulator MalT
MGTLARRDRLLATLRLRHELTLCGLVAPAGFGRTVVLDQAAADLGPKQPTSAVPARPETPARVSSLPVCRAC